MKISNVIIKLIYLFVFLASFEYILDNQFGVDTVFKPYRLVGILLILFYFLFSLSRFKTIFQYPEDKALFLIYIWGSVITLFVMATSNFDLYSYLGLTNIYIVFFCYLTIKGKALTQKQINNILLIILIASILNATYINYNAYFLGSYGRLKGFFKNSNYSAFTLNVASYYLLYRLLHLKEHIVKKAIYLPLILFMGMAVSATGSRTGIIAFVFFGILYLSFSSTIRKKIVYVGIFFLFLFAFGIKGKLTNLFNPESNVGANRIERLVKGNEIETEPRPYIWKAGIQAGMDSGFMGIGFFSFRKQFDDFISKIEVPYSVVGFSDSGLGLHSYYLTILVEAGIIPFLFLLYFIYKTLQRRFSALYFNPANKMNGLKLILVLNIFFVMILSNTMLVPIFWTVFALSTKDFTD